METTVDTEGFGFGVFGLMLTFLQELSALQYINSKGTRYLGSCRFFSIHQPYLDPKLYHLQRGGGQRGPAPISN